MSFVVTGHDVAQALRDDHEETAIAIVALAKGFDDREREELVDHLEREVIGDDDAKQRLIDFAHLLLEGCGVKNEDRRDAG